MDEKEFLKQLDKRLEKVVTKEDLEGVKSDLESLKLDMVSLKSDMMGVKDNVKRANNRVDEVYNLADGIKKGIDKREQEFYSREAKVDRKLGVLGEKVSIDISKIE